MSIRIEKINSLIAQIAASFFTREIVFPDACFVTVMRVETSGDLKRATIFISVFPESKEEEVVSIIRKNAGRMKKHFASKLTFKFLPECRIEIDKTERARRRFEELMKKGDNSKSPAR